MGFFDPPKEDPNKGKYVKLIRVFKEEKLEKALTDLIISGRIIKEIHYCAADGYSALVIFDVEKEEELKNR